MRNLRSLAAIFYNAGDPAHVCNPHARSSPETSVAVVFHDRWS